MEHGNRILSEEIEDPSETGMKSKAKQFKKLLRKDRRRKYVSVISLMVIGLIGISSLVLSQRLLKPVGDATRSQAAVPSARVSVKLDEELRSDPKTLALVHLRATPPTPENIKTTQDALLAELKGYSFTVKTRYDYVSAIALEVDASTLAKLKTLGDYVSSIENNFELKQQMQQARKVDQAPEAETAGYVPSSNIAVVVIDSGVNASHPFLKNRVVDEVCIGDECPAPSGPGSAKACTWNTDPIGQCNHGTLVAGAITGGDTGTTDRLAGIVPGVKIIAIRAGRRQASSNTGEQDVVVFYQADMLTAYNWILGKIADPNYPYEIGAINMSLDTVGDQSALCGDSNDRSNYLAQLWDAKAPVVAAAMNNGYPSSLGNPACSPFAIAVGSVNKQKQMSTFSNAANWQPNFILAPGGFGTGAPAGENIKTSTGTTEYTETWGTSFAAPQVAGAIALMRSIVPNAPVDDLIKGIKSTAITVTDTRNGVNNSYPLLQLKGALDYVKSSASAWSNTSSCTGTTGTTASCNMGSTLGVSTDSLKGEVLQASTQGKMLLATVAYRASIVPTAQVFKMTYLCGNVLSPLSRLGGSTGRASFTDQHTEMWYMFDPSCENGKLEASFATSTAGTTPANPEDRILTGTFFADIPKVNFIAGIVRTAGYNYPPGSRFLDLRNTGPKGSRFICTYSTYPNGGQNVVTSTALQWKQIWGSGKVVNNIQSAIGVSDPRTSDGQLMNIRWDSTQSWPWAATCIDLNTKTSSTPTPPPTPAPIPSVNLKVNGSDGPVTAKAGDSVLLSWTTSAVTSCTASGTSGWNGAKGYGSAQDSWIVKPGSLTYTLMCTGPNSAQASDQVTVKAPPLVELRVNGSETSITLDKGIAPTLAWYVVGATSCSASGGWSGSKAITSGSEKAPMPTASAKYELTCVGAGGTTTDSVSLSLTGNTAQTGYSAQYYSDTNFQKLVGTNIVSKIDNDWSTNGVAFPGVPTNYYSIRYSAQITPGATGTYTFLTTSDNRVRVYVDDKPVISNWDTHGRSVDQGTVVLTAGKQYNLVIEYAEETGSAAIIFQAGIGTSPAALQPKAVSLPIGLDGGGLTATYYTSTGSVGSTTKIPVMAYVWTTQPNSQLVRTLTSAKYSGKLKPTVTATYTFMMPSALNFYINGVKKTWTALPAGGYTTTQALTANTNYDIFIEAGLGTYTNFYLKWKYGSLPYSVLDLRNLRP